MIYIHFWLKIFVSEDSIKHAIEFSLNKLKDFAKQQSTIVAVKAQATEKAATEIITEQAKAIDSTQATTSVPGATTDQTMAQQQTA